jgi:hypothetical protein
MQPCIFSGRLNAHAYATQSGLTLMLQQPVSDNGLADFGVAIIDPGSMHFTKANALTGVLFPLGLGLFFDRTHVIRKAQPC